MANTPATGEAAGDAPGDWAKDLVRRAGRQISTLRGGRSARWLSERTAELGYRVSPTVIAKLDSGHRGEVLSVAELLVLAAALNTSPAALLYPGPYERETEVLPGEFASEFRAVQWFSGLEHGFTDRGDDGAETARARAEHRDHTRALRLWRQLDDWQQRRSSITVRRGGELSDEQRGQIAFYDSQIEQLREELGLDEVSDA